MDKSEKIEAYFAEEHDFQEGINLLRELVLKTHLQETFKWMFPTYTIDGKNVLSICKFNHHFGIWFFNGVFLSDPKKVLQNAQEGKTQAMRHWKFHNNEEIDEKTVLGYINEAIENQKKGIELRPERKKTTEVTISQKLQVELNKNPKIKKAFETLSAYKQKEYSEYIETAKQEKTKASRLEKILPMITKGKGLNDRYRK